PLRRDVRRAPVRAARPRCSGVLRGDRRRRRAPRRGSAGGGGLCGRGARTPSLAVTARRYRARRSVRLSDTDSNGRLRLDAIARFLQDVAADDILDAGWAPDDHIWVVRRTVL